MSILQDKKNGLLDILLEVDKITKDDVEKIIQLQEKTHEKVDRILLNLGIISEEDLRDALGSLFSLKIWQRKKELMNNRFFEQPILNSPYKYPTQHWELDDLGQPTQKIIDTRRSAKFITPIPKPRKRKGKAQQQALFVDPALSTAEQQYDPTSIINELRHHVDQWRILPNTNDWKVTPETVRLLQFNQPGKKTPVQPEKSKF